MSDLLPHRHLTDDVSVAPQLTPDAMAEAARIGFRSVINNRPDFEHGPQQPTNASIEAAARAAGLEYRFLPVDGGYQSPQEITAFAQLLNELDSNGVISRHLQPLLDRIHQLLGTGDLRGLRAGSVRVITGIGASPAFLECQRLGQGGRGYCASTHREGTSWPHC
jgi:protein tyrosine phosphatase (PTP) superfamily phosphohydrolase (DUF442 family)